MSKSEFIYFKFTQFYKEELTINENEQNVQRLEIDTDSNKISLELRNLVQHDENLLKQREFLIKNNLTRGNRTQLIDYKKKLPTELTEAQLLWSIGLVLSDATIQSNTSLNNQTFRLKIQQAYFNVSLLEMTLEILKLWVFGMTDIPGRKMKDISTIQHKAFNKVAEIFKDPTQILSEGDCVRKVIPTNIEQYLEPITLGAWYCGDGGRRDYGKNEGKAIQFYSQGFSKEDNERLAQALKNKYGWNARAKKDVSHSKKRDLYLIQIEAENFESFVDIVKPYILPNFHKRLPSPRKPGS